MPVRNVLVGDTGGNIEHDNTTLSVDVVTVTETTELLLTSGIPDIELDSTVVLFRLVTIARWHDSKRGSSAGYDIRC